MLSSDNLDFAHMKRNAAAVEVCPERNHEPEGEVPARCALVVCENPKPSSEENGLGCVAVLPSCQIELNALQRIGWSVISGHLKALQAILAKSTEDCP